MPYIDLSSPEMGKLKKQLAFRVEAVAVDLRNEIVYQMEGGDPRTGRKYRVPGTGVIDSETNRIRVGTGTTYTASAPGEPPAVATGAYVASWQSTPAVIQGDKITAYATNDRKTEDGRHFVGELLEYGTDRATPVGGGGSIVGYSEGMAPRPHIRPALENVAARHHGRVVE